MAQVQTAGSHETAESLDEEINTIRDQIQQLTKWRRLAINSLLQTTKVQERLQKSKPANNNAHTDLPDEEDPLSNPSATSKTESSPTEAQHLTNMHRLAFTVTTFPFTDPSPNTNLNGRLLGIRFDHCSRLGTFDNPFYILFRRLEPNGDDWRIHRHTIPAFIPLARLEHEYLPLEQNDAGGGGDSDDELNSGDEPNNKHGLHAFVRKVRYELASWRLRREAIEFLQEELGLVESKLQNGKKGGKKGKDDDGRDVAETSNSEEDDEDEDEDEDTEMPDVAVGRYGISSIESTAFEARMARICWTDGTIGRIKISDKGLVEKAVVVGDSGRIRGVENLLMDGESRIEKLVEKLKILVGE